MDKNKILKHYLAGVGIVSVIGEIKVELNPNTDLTCFERKHTNYECRQREDYDISDYLTRGFEITDTTSTSAVSLKIIQ